MMETWGKREKMKEPSGAVVTRKELDRAEGRVALIAPLTGFSSRLNEVGTISTAAIGLPT